MFPRSSSGASSSIGNSGTGLNSVANFLGSSSMSGSASPRGPQAFGQVLGGGHSSRDRDPRRGSSPSGAVQLGMGPVEAVPKIAAPKVAAPKVAAKAAPNVAAKAAPAPKAAALAPAAVEGSDLGALAHEVQLLTLSQRENDQLAAELNPVIKRKMKQLFLERGTTDLMFKS